MDLEFAARIGYEALMTSYQVSGPMLIAALLVGLLISVFQAVTQINEMTLTFIPKILVAVLVIAMTYDKIVGALVSFTTRMFTDWGGFLP